MAREFDMTKPLSDEDLEWLRARKPGVVVDYLVARAGQKPARGTAKTETDAPKGDAPVEPESAGEDAEDLIGAPAEPFDPARHTVDEVLAYLETADPEEAQRVLSEEQDGKGRAGILKA